MDLQLCGQTVVIGGGLAEVFAEESCRLHLVSRPVPKLSSLAERTRATHGVEVVVQEQDISAKGAARRTFEAAGVAYVLVNNAGAIIGRRPLQLDKSRWREGWEGSIPGRSRPTGATRS